MSHESYIWRGGSLEISEKRAKAARAQKQIRINKQLKREIKNIDNYIIKGNFPEAFAKCIDLGKEREFKDLMNYEIFSKIGIGEKIFDDKILEGFINKLKPILGDELILEIKKRIKNKEVIDAL